MNTFEALADLSLGASCHGCGAPGRSPCPDCREHLLPQVRPHARAGIQQSGRSIPVLSGTKYDECSSGFIVGFKDGGAWQLSSVLGGLLLACWQLLRPPDSTIIVPISSHPATVRSRGFDHTGTLARWLSRRTGAPAKQLLRKTRKDPDQVSLNGRDRQQRPMGSMRAAPCTNSAVGVVLVDDVLTTGGTAAEAVRALDQAGHRIRAVLIVAERGQH
jgi:predicted amidophosphoribosyltransferase